MANTRCEWTEEVERSVTMRRLRREASGVCADSGLPFLECMEGPCDCFLTQQKVDEYVQWCKDEIVRLETVRT